MAETDLAHLKTTLAIDVLHCQTEADMMKALTLYAVAYNLVRLVMVEAARRQGVAPARVSFVDALRWLVSSPPGTPLPRLVVSPERPGRLEPRSKSCRPRTAPCGDPAPAGAGCLCRHRPETSLPHRMQPRSARPNSGP